MPKQITIDKAAWDYETESRAVIIQYSNGKRVGSEVVRFAELLDRYLQTEYRDHGVKVVMIGEEGKV